MVHKSYPKFEVEHVINIILIHRILGIANSCKEVTLTLITIHDELSILYEQDNKLLPVDINRLGAAVESSISSPNTRLYGSVHNLGHDLMAVITDPDGRYQDTVKLTWIKTDSGLSFL